MSEERTKYQMNLGGVLVDVVFVGAGLAGDETGVCPLEEGVLAIAAGEDVEDLVLDVDGGVDVVVVVVVVVVVLGPLVCE